MSDQDFFFDEEDEKPAKAAKPSPKTTGGKPAAKTSASKAAPAKAAPTKAAAPEAEGFLFETMSVSKGIAALSIACALLLGLAGGILIGQSRAETVTLSDIPAASSTGQTAPQLTQEQLNSGQLPAGHPSIGATASSTATGK